MEKQKKKKNFFVNPLKNTNIGLRSGKDLRAGKVIRVNERGIENLEDYYSESDADFTVDLSTTFSRSSTKYEKPITEEAENVGVPPDNKQSTTSQSGKVGKSTAYGWLWNKNIGRRTGKDVLAGKVIRKNSMGFDNLNDYFSESSDAESLLLSRSRISVGLDNADDTDDDANLEKSQSHVGHVTSAAEAGIRQSKDGESTEHSEDGCPMPQAGTREPVVTIPTPGSTRGNRSVNSDSMPINRPDIDDGSSQQDTDDRLLHQETDEYLSQQETDDQSSQEEADNSLLQPKTGDGSSQQKVDDHLSQQKTDNRSSQQKTDKQSSRLETDNRSSQQKTDKQSSRLETDNRSSQQKTDKQSSRLETDNRSSQQKTDKQSSRHKTDNRSSQQKEDDHLSQQKTENRSLQQKTDKPSSRHETDNRSSQQKMDDRSSRQEIVDRSSQQKTDKQSSRHKTDNRSSQQKVDDHLSQQKTENRSLQQKIDKPSSRHETDNRSSQQKMDDRSSRQEIVDRSSQQKTDKQSSQEQTNDHMLKGKSDNHLSQREDTAFRVSQNDQMVNEEVLSENFDPTSITEKLAKIVAPKEKSVTFVAPTERTMEETAIEKTSDITALTGKSSKSNASVTINIGGNVTGSLTKCDSDLQSTGLTPTFRTRKKLSFSAQELERMSLSGRSQKLLNDRKVINNNPFIKGQSQKVPVVGNVCDPLLSLEEKQPGSENDSIDNGLRIVSDDSVDTKRRSRGSNKIITGQTDKARRQSKRKSKVMDDKAAKPEEIFLTETKQTESQESKQTKPTKRKSQAGQKKATQKKYSISVELSDSDDSSFVNEEFEKSLAQKKFPRKSISNQNRDKDEELNKNEATVKQRKAFVLMDDEAESESVSEVNRKASVVDMSSKSSLKVTTSEARVAKNRGNTRKSSNSKDGIHEVSYLEIAEQEDDMAERFCPDDNDTVVGKKTRRCATSHGAIIKIPLKKIGAKSRQSFPQPLVNHHAEVEIHDSDDDTPIIRKREANISAKNRKSPLKKIGGKSRQSLPKSVTTHHTEDESDDSDDDSVIGKYPESMIYLNNRKTDNSDKNRLSEKSNSKVNSSVNKGRKRSSKVTEPGEASPEKRSRKNRSGIKRSKSEKGRDVGVTETKSRTVQQSDERSRSKSTGKSTNTDTQKSQRGRRRKGTQLTQDDGVVLEAEDDTADDRLPTDVPHHVELVDEKPLSSKAVASKTEMTKVSQGVGRLKKTLSKKKRRKRPTIVLPAWKAKKKTTQTKTVKTTSDRKTKKEVFPNTKSRQKLSVGYVEESVGEIQENSRRTSQDPSAKSKRTSRVGVMIKHSGDSSQQVDTVENTAGVEECISDSHSIGRMDGDSSPGKDNVKNTADVEDGASLSPHKPINPPKKRAKKKKNSSLRKPRSSSKKDLNSSKKETDARQSEVTGCGGLTKTSLARSSLPYILALSRATTTGSYSPCSATPGSEFSIARQEEMFRSGVSFRQLKVERSVKKSTSSDKKANSKRDDDDDGDVDNHDDGDYDNHDDGDVDIHDDDYGDVDNQGYDDDIGDDRSSPDKHESIIHKRGTRLPSVGVSESSTQSPASLTPCLVAPGNKRSKGRRVTISNEISEAVYNVPSDASSSDTPTSTKSRRRSSNQGDQTTMISMSSSPRHICEMTTSESPKPFQRPEKTKIILPDLSSTSGLRRSRRTRVQTLEHHKNERILYKYRQSGGFVVAGIIPSQEAKIIKHEQEVRKRRLKSQRIRRKKSKNFGSPPRNLSMHAEIPSQLNVTVSDEIAVINPDMDTEVFVECFASKDCAPYVGSTGNPATPDDAFVMSRVLDQKGFGTGVLLLRPLQEKPTQLVSRGSLIFELVRGMITMTIHTTCVIMKAGDSCFVPRGNSYSVRNLRTDEAKLSYTVLKETVSDTTDN